MKRIIFSIIILYFYSISYSQLSEKVYYSSPLYVDIGAGYLSYKFQDTTLSLILTPINLILPITNDLSVTIDNKPYRIENNTEKRKRIITNISDTKIALRYYFLKHQALVNVFLNIPTGKTRLSLEEFDVSTNIGLSILKYQLNTLGEGFNSGLSFNYAFPISKKNTIGFGFSYNNKSEYEPINFERIEKDLILKYNPPNDFNINISYFHQISNIKINFDGLYSFFSYAKINGNSVYKPGNMFSTILALLINSDKINNIFQINIRKSAKNKIKYSDFWNEYDNSFLLELDHRFDIRLLTRLNVYTILQYRNYGKHQDNWNGVINTINSSHFFSIGAGTRIQLTDFYNLNLFTKYNTAKIDIGEAKIINGIETFLRINFSF